MKSNFVNDLTLSRRDTLKAQCVAAGFEFLEIENPFLTDNIRALQLADWDTHPNAEGHRLIAQNMYDLMMQKAVEFKLERASARYGEPEHSLSEPD